MPSSRTSFQSTHEPRRAQIGSELVFKIVERAAWDAARRDGVFKGSADDLRDGFIHLSSAEQVDATLAKHFKNQDDLLLVAFDAAALGAPLKWESSRGGALFPHLYAPLAPQLALWARELRSRDDGAPASGLDSTAC